jgi:hypothetical protein
VVSYYAVVTGVRPVRQPRACEKPHRPRPLPLCQQLGDPAAGVCPVIPSSPSPPLLPRVVGLSRCIRQVAVRKDDAGARPEGKEGPPVPGPETAEAVFEVFQGQPLPRVREEEHPGEEVKEAPGLLPKRRAPFL